MHLAIYTPTTTLIDPIYMFCNIMAIISEEKREDDSIERQYRELGVKQLYENGVHKVPLSYIFPTSERPNRNISESQYSHLSIQLPIIDFAELQGPNRPQVLHSLSHACEHYGFFQVVNHGISNEVMRKMMDVSKRFFDLPFVERGKYMRSDMQAPVRYGTSYSQTRDSVLCWRDFLKLTSHPLSHYLPYWPSSPPDLRDVAGTYAEETKQLFMRLMEGVLESLGISERDDEEGKKMMKEMEEDGSQIMVVNYYPPCPQPELTLGLSPHSDCGFLTLLFQHHHIQALQIQHKSQWLTVQPLPNTFIVNVGDHLEIYSNGKYKSVLHRVLVNSVERISVASLHSVPLSSTVRPSPKLINEANPKHYKDTNFGDFIDYISTREMRESSWRKDFLDSRKLS